MAIISLAEKSREANQRVIDMLEDVLAIAKTGAIREIGICYSNDEKEHFTRAEYESHLRMVGCASILLHDVMHKGDVP